MLIISFDSRRPSVCSHKPLVFPFGIASLPCRRFVLCLRETRGVLLRRLSGSLTAALLFRSAPPLLGSAPAIRWSRVRQFAGLQILVCMIMSLRGERSGPVHPLWASGCAAPLTRLLMLLLHVVCLALLQTLRMFVFLRLPRRALALQVVVHL